jgi:hypothetical protein
MPRSKTVERKVIKDGFPPAARGVLALDFDGTLFPFKSDTGHMNGPKSPYPGAVSFAQTAKELGFTIVIFTSRLSPTWWEAEGWDFDKAREKQYAYVAGLLNKFKIPYDLITSEKIPATWYVDDRALSFEGDWQTIHERILGN